MNPKSTIDYAGKGYSSEADYNRYSMDAKVSPTQQVTNEKFATPQSGLIGTQQGNTLVNTRVNPISTITADTLTPSAPIVIPPRKTSDTANIELGASIAGAMLPPTNSELNASGLYTPAKQSETDATKQRINELMGQAKNKATDTATINEQNQISQKEQAYRDASNAYLRKKATYQQEIEKIYSDPYITREQAQQKVSEISRIQNADLANLAIEANIAQGNYQGALDLADRAIKAKYEPIEAEIKNLKDLYTLYQNDMSESEKFLAEKAIQERKDEKDFQQQKDLLDYKAKIDEKAAYLTAALKGTSLRPPTGVEKTNLGFYNRAEQATKDISAIEDTIAKQGLKGQFQLEFAPNILKTQEQQQYLQSQRAFTEARLRKESGAAIPQTEIDSDRKTYFAQPGDTQAVLEQKRKARQVVLDGLKYSSGNAYEDYYGYPPTFGTTDQTPATTQSNTIRVKLSNGQTGTIDANEFDPKSMTKL